MPPVTKVTLLCKRVPYRNFHGPFRVYTELLMTSRIPGSPLSVFTPVWAGFIIEVTDIMELVRMEKFGVNPDSIQLRRCVLESKFIRAYGEKL